MGLDQWIIRGSHTAKPVINDDTGEWVNCKELLQLRKEYWLHNRVMSIGEKKLGMSKEDLNCKYIPLTKEDLKEILEDSKMCVKTRSNHLIHEYFDYNVYDDFEQHCILDGMRTFNRCIGNALRHKKTEYYYYSWW